MIEVTWNLPDGSVHSAAVEPGSNLMQAAVDNSIDNILGECGGCLSCATCHVYVDERWVDKVGEPDDMEDAMLDAVEAPRTPASRLSCQITAAPGLNGLVLHVPDVD
jgi:ferredoxin, 2Fe-2S